MLRLRYFRTDRPLLLRLGLVLFLSLSGPACQDRSIAPPSIPVVFDTDFGGDIDDAWALALLLSSPELELKLVIVSGPDPSGKARILAKFLEKGRAPGCADRHWRCIGRHGRSPAGLGRRL